MIVIGLIYFSAIAIAFYLLNLLLVKNLLIQSLYVDLIVTLFVFLFSLVLNNSSVYDPYWSVIPPVFCWFWMQNKMSAPDSADWIIFSIVCLWAIRLTANWATGWKGLSQQDWRYGMLREKNPSLWLLTNLMGIHVFPTVMVFLGMLPAFYFFQTTGKTVSGSVFTGAFVSIIGILLELVGDLQMRRFKRKASKNDFIQTGLWKYIRHPNYLGEILFWTGLFIAQSSIGFVHVWTGVGFISIYLMFRFASIPMMEQRNLENRPGYKNYIEKVSVLIPFI